MEGDVPAESRKKRYVARVSSGVAVSSGAPKKSKLFRDFEHVWNFEAGRDWTEGHRFVRDLKEKSSVAFMAEMSRLRREYAAELASWRKGESEGKLKSLRSVGLPVSPAAAVGVEVGLEDDGTEKCVGLIDDLLVEWAGGRR